MEERIKAMHCPVCKTHEQYTQSALKAEGFSEQIITCKICGSIWSINHGMTELVCDAQERSFMEALSECVESDDYSLAA